MEITQDWLRRTFRYDPETGEFLNRVDRSYCSKAGEIAGWIAQSGYHQTKICGQHYKAHRLIWMYMTGHWPEGQIDHINRVKHDNRWENLRDCTPEQNSQNIEKKGYTWDKTGNCYVAFIHTGGKKRQVGRFKCPNAAKQAYLKAKQEYHPYFYLSEPLSDRATD